MHHYTALCSHKGRVVFRQGKYKIKLIFRSKKVKNDWHAFICVDALACYATTIECDPWGYHGSLSNGMVIYFAFDDRYVTVGVALAVNVVVVDFVTVVPMVCY